MRTLSAWVLSCLESILDHDNCRRTCSCFRADEGGVVAVIFAIVFSAIFLAMAIAIDYAQTVRAYTRVQNALDTAALAAAHKLGMPDQDTQGRNDADAYF